MRLAGWILVAAALLPAAAAASEAASVERGLAQILPPQPLARRALLSTPRVLKAQAELDVAKAVARGLSAGDHEVMVSALVAERNVRNIASYTEYSLDVARAVRLPGKAQLDRQIGALDMTAAEDAVDDAVHQAALILSGAWFDWIETAASVALERATVAGAEREVAALRRKVELQDAAPLDLELGQAALAAARSKLAQAQGAFEAARLVLSQGFPELVLPSSPPAAPSPLVLDSSAAEWRGTVVANSHEIRIADSLARSAEAQAARVRLDRRPDPTIGLRAFSEQGGREQGIGLFISTPIGGGKRSALVEAQLARASAARADAARVRREVEAVAATDVAAIDSTYQAWRTADAALQDTETATRRQQRAYELGERDLTELLAAQRQLHEVQRTELAARVAAWRAFVRLRVDAQVLWGDED